MKSLTLILGLILLSPPLLAKTLTFDDCSKVFLGGEKLESFRKLDEEENAKETNQVIEQLLKKKDCKALLGQGLLKSNGLLENRNSISSKILETFVNLHHSWLMPKDLDQPQRCNDKFHKDIYDFKTPAYHLTKTLFQTDRKAALALTSYSDLRSLRVGSNPIQSDLTGIKEEEYEKLLKLDDSFSLTGKEAIVGFLYRRNVEMKQVATSTLLSQKDSFTKVLSENKIPLYRHLGAGLLGTPSFLIHNAPQEAFDQPLYMSNGKNILPRKLAKSVLENLLCENLLTHKYSGEEDFSWNHPITKEKKCLGCHHSLDSMAAGFRNLTYVKSNESCSEESPQILIPQYFNTNYTMSFWQNLSDEEIEKKREFFTSYPVGYISEKKDEGRFVGIRQLGKSISEDPRFYQCQVKKYYQFLYNKVPSQELIKKLGEAYQEHQNGLK
ncbi:MAG: hypothetical protein NXH75_14690, partial [Halobacteriovoraceae bacterium]|nr:hypothetical protein [Halobacteriovoraceae bacterium]